MHADLHPGNILVYVTPSENEEECQPQYITFVDAGMVAQLTQRESINYIGLISSIGTFFQF